MDKQGGGGGGGHEDEGDAEQEDEFTTGKDTGIVVIAAIGVVRSESSRTEVPLHVGSSVTSSTAGGCIFGGGPEGIGGRIMSPSSAFSPTKISPIFFRFKSSFCRILISLHMQHEFLGLPRGPSLTGLSRRGPTI